MPTPLPFQCLVGAVLLATIPASASTLIISDDFGTDASGRSPGIPLGGALTDKGGAAWESHPADIQGIIFSSDNSVTPGSEKSASASVPLPDNSKRIVLSADLKPAGCDWTGLSLGGPALDSHSFSPNGAGLTLLLRESGHYSVMIRGHKPIKIAEAQLTGFSATTFTRAELIYDREQNSVSVRINGQLLHNQIDLNAHNYRPALNRAGVRFNAGPIRPGAPEIDNVSISVTR